MSISEHIVSMTMNSCINALSENQIIYTSLNKSQSENTIEIIPTESLPDQEQYPTSFIINKVTLSVIQNEKNLSTSDIACAHHRKASEDQIFKKPPSIEVLERQRERKRKIQKVSLKVKRNSF